MLERLIRAGLNVARLNFSHGEFSSHAEVVRRIREAARATGRRVAIMADLPGPKMRLGKIAPEPIQLVPGDRFTLTNEDIVGDAQRVSMSFEPLPRVVKPGNRLFLNDGLVQLVVERVAGNDVECTVAVGGELRSRKGLNLPGIDLGISAFTEHDRACLEFALGAGVDAVSQSFVERAADIEAVRAAAAKIGRVPFIIAKIERVRRARALRRNPRRRRRHHGRPRRSRRGGADRGDRAHAEAAHREGEPRGQTGHHRHADARVDDQQPPAHARRGDRRGQCDPRRHRLRDALRRVGDGQISRGSRDDAREDRRLHRDASACAAALAATARSFAESSRATRGDRMASLVEHALDTVPCDVVLVPTRGGTTARVISRCKPPVWIIAPSSDPAACQGLAFSYGVHPVDLAEEPDDWREFAANWLRDTVSPRSM